LDQKAVTDPELAALVAEKVELKKAFERAVVEKQRTKVAKLEAENQARGHRAVSWKIKLERAERNFQNEQEVIKLREENAQLCRYKSKCARLSDKVDGHTAETAHLARAAAEATQEVAAAQARYVAAGVRWSQHLDSLKVEHEEQLVKSEVRHQGVVAVLVAEHAVELEHWQHHVEFLQEKIDEQQQVVRPSALKAPRVEAGGFTEPVVPLEFSSTCTSNAPVFAEGAWGRKGFVRSILCTGSGPVRRVPPTPPRVLQKRCPARPPPPPRRNSRGGLEAPDCGKRPRMCTCCCCCSIAAPHHTCSGREGRGLT